MASTRIRKKVARLSSIYQSSSYNPPLRPFLPRLPLPPSYHHPLKNLQPIPKLRILPIRNIRKLNIRLMPLPPFTSHSIPPLILPLIVYPEYKHQNCSCSASHNDCDFGGDVGGCVGGAEGQGSDYVAETEGDEEDGVHGDLWRMS